jgi:hypothetical protein
LRSIQSDLIPPDPRVIDGFEEVNGIHPGFRRHHAKGVCIAGAFDSNGQGRLSKGAVFRPGKVPVIGRLSLAGGARRPGGDPQHGAELPPPMARNGGWP